MEIILRKNLTTLDKKIKNYPKLLKFNIFIKIFIAISIIVYSLFFSPTEAKDNLSSLSEELIQHVALIETRKADSFDTAQSSFLALVRTLAKNKVVNDSAWQSPYLQKVYTEEDFAANIRNSSGNINIVERLLFGENNNIRYQTINENTLNTLSDQVASLIKNLMSSDFSRQQSSPEQRAIQTIDSIIFELEQSMGDSIAKANPAFLSFNHSWFTLDFYFWQLAQVELILIPETDNQTEAQLLQQQFINVYRKLISISYSQYLLGASALFKAGGNHETLASLIDHDESKISLVNQIKQVSGRKKILKLIDELKKLKITISNINSA